MGKKPHSNLLENPNLHHLYGIYDYENHRFYKFGISDKPVSNHSSSRILQQVTLFNQVAGKKRFASRILQIEIKGRKNARRLEDYTILAFMKKYNRLPQGNPKHRFLKESI